MTSPQDILVYTVNQNRINSRIPEVFHLKSLHFVNEILKTQLVKGH